MAKIANAELVFMVSRAQKGEHIHRHRLCLALQPLVQWEIKQIFRGPRRDNADLIQDGNEGLLNAIEHFRADGGMGFIGYAIIRIRERILKAVLNTPPVTIRGHGNKANKVFWRAWRETADEDVAEDVALPVEEVAKIREALKAVDLVAASEPTEDPTTEIDDDIARREILTILSTSTDRNYMRNDRITAQRLNGVTLTVIARREHISRERVRQIEYHTMTRIRARLRREF